MEFGRKGDAKRAMKLHHREGISLKQAWKRIKSGKKSKSKKSKRYCMSPKKKKAVSNAKKAMKLHHREGITLKQAWKKINKFGDTVCPKGYEMNPKWNGRRIDHQCIKECGFLQSRDPVTNRCKGPLGGVKEPSPKAAAKGSPLPRIPRPGYEINPLTGRERKMCLPGQYRDPDTGRCKKIRPQLQPLMASSMPYPMTGVAPPFRSGGLMDYGKKYKFGGMHIPAMKYHKSMFGRRTSFGTCSACNVPRY